MEEIIASAGTTFNIPPHPEGQFAAKCIDIVDLGMVEMTWQGQTRRKHRIFLRFFCGQYFEDESGERRPLWIDKYFTLSLHENSALRPFLEAWRGRKFTEEELRGFNVAKLLHADALIQVSHNITPEKTYANIDSIMRLPKGMEPAPMLEGYVRVKDRPKDEGPVKAPSPFDDEDDDLPFD